MFSNQPLLIDCLKRSLQLAAVHRYRVLLVLAGDANSQIKLVLDTYTQFALNVTPVTIMHVPDRHSNSDVSDQINALLGSENKCLVFDANVHFNERLFAASAATVVAGGLLVLQAPTLDSWSSLSTLETNSEKTRSGSVFLHRFKKKLMQCHSHAYPDIHPPAPDCALFVSVVEPKDKTHSDNTAKQIDTTPDWQIEQQQLVQQLQTKLTTDEAAVVVVQGDRGRGKSALIGHALNALNESCTLHPPSITLTANRIGSCKVLLKHTEQALRFLAVDVALKTHHDLLIVEEAGSLPIAVLLKLMQLSRKIVFATTVQGYEGAGRGFAIRFAKHLDSKRPDWLKLCPNEPIRWSKGDPVEAFVNNALMLNATLPVLNTSVQLQANSSKVRQVNQQELLDDDRLLENIFGLLLSAHYQTTPADLRNMLDQPQLRVYAQFCNGEITGAALLAMEGEIPIELHEAILTKQRRLPDQILPQVLAQVSGQTTVMASAYARIVRIAIHPDLQRQGFGRQLFKQLHLQLAPNTLIGASFGADTISLSFWLSLGCHPVHYGFKTNPRSGQRAVCVLLNEHAKTRETIELASQVLHANLQAIDSIGDEPDPVVNLIIKNTDTIGTKLDSEQAWSLIKDYALAHRSFGDTVGLLLTHKRLLVEPSIQAHVLSVLQSLNKLSPKQRREKDMELRQIISHQFNLY